MTTRRASSKVVPKRYISLDKGTNVLAFQFPSEGLEFIRILWKQPEANAGDWLVKTGLGMQTQAHLLMTNEHFTKCYRRPYSGRLGVKMTENNIPIVTLRGDRRLVIGWLQMYNDGSFSGQIDPLGSFTHEIVAQLKMGKFAFEVDQTWLPGESLASMDYGSTTELPKRQPLSAGYPAELLARNPQVPSAPFMYQNDALKAESDNEQLRTRDFLLPINFVESTDPREGTQDKEQ